MRGTLVHVVAIMSVLLVLWGIGGCRYQILRHQETQRTLLDPDLDWYGDNREQLDRFILRYGGELDPASGGLPRVAVFDWDNTVIRNDIGDAVFFQMLHEGRVRIPEDNDWSRTSPYLTAAALAYLSAACDPRPQENDHRPPSACTDALLAVYLDQQTPQGEPAFAGYNHHWMEPAYAWAVHLMAGQRPEQIRALAESVIGDALQAEVGATRQVGSRAGLNAWIRIYPQMANLIATLRDNGFDVWVVSASAQLIVEPFAERVGVPPERVIGVRSLRDDAGRIRYDLEGCGPVADGENALIPYRKGKRCWINRVVLGSGGEESPAQMLEAPTHAPLFAAGDSDTDVCFMYDAAVLRLAINRQKAELMCRAYHGQGKGWIINPMFIDPLAPRSEPYPCSRSACTNPRGEAVPCLDSSGQVIPDQPDHAAP